jgi:TolA-binding protein
VTLKPFLEESVMSRRLLALLTVACLFLAGAGRSVGDSDDTKSALVLAAAQKECLSLEPILVVVRAEGDNVRSVPARVADSKASKEKGTLSFEIKPAVKARAGAKPLPLEAGQTSAKRARLFDLLEWYQFPAEGEFTVTAVIKNGDATVTSKPIVVTLRKPDKKDSEAGPVDRIHHVPWSNYVTDAFCGDTFDVVKRWPDSKLAKYCHYYNGLHHLHKKEYDKAVASLSVVVEKHPDLLLAADADHAIHECLLAQGKKEDAVRHLAALEKRLKKDTTGRFTK